MPGDLAEHPARIDRELAIRVDDSLADRHARQIDAIDVGSELQVVANVHRRNQEPEVLCQLAAHAADAREQVTALLLVDQRHQAVADLQPQQVHRSARPPRSAHATPVAPPL